MQELDSHKEDNELIPKSEQKKSLRASVKDGCFYAGMVGIGESYFIPLIEAIGASNTQVGLFASLPQLGNALSQFFAIHIIEKIRLRKHIILVSASTQAAMLGLISLALFFEIRNPWVYISIAFTYLAANGVSIPAWNSLIGDITQGVDRGKYFGTRNGLAQIVLFTALMLAGLILGHFNKSEIPLFGFAVIMLIAMLSRVGSVFYLSQHYDVAYRRVEGAYFSFWAFLIRTRYSNFAKFTLMAATMSFAVSISGPFFAIYIIRHLGLSYLQYAISMGIIVVVQYLMMKQWGIFADKFGNRRVMRLSGFLLPPLPIIWIFADSFTMIIIVAILGGIAWGGWTLSIGNFIFDAVSSEKRARCSAYLQVLNSVGIFLGANLGAYLTTLPVNSISLGFWHYDFFTTIQFVFLVSGILRLIIWLLFLPFIKEVRDVSKPEARDLIMLFTNILPLQKMKFTPLNMSGNGNGSESDDSDKDLL